MDKEYIVNRLQTKEYISIALNHKPFLISYNLTCFAIIYLTSYSINLLKWNQNEDQAGLRTEKVWQSLFPSAGFIWLFYEDLYKRCTFLL